MGKVMSSRASHSVDAKQNRGKPSGTSTPCSVCAYPIRNQDVDVVACGRCGAVAHEPCFWRALPIEAWLRYLRRREEARPPSTFDRRWICATCRGAQRRKPLARMSKKSLARARDAECICSHIYAHHRQQRSRIATVCEQCSCVGFAPRDQRAWNRLAGSG